MSHDVSPLNKWTLLDLGIIILSYHAVLHGSASSYTFCTWKCALSFLETGKVPRRAFIQKTSVHDLYSFEISADLVIVLLVLFILWKMHGILFPSCLYFGHIIMKSKVVKFVSLPLGSYRIVFLNFQMVLYLHFFLSLVCFSITIINK
jgi:hypothetical protein